MSKTFSSLIKYGFDDFYKGQIAKDILSDLETLGSPLKKLDFDNYNASFVNPLQLDVMNAKLLIYLHQLKVLLQYLSLEFLVSCRKIIKKILILFIKL